MQLEGADFMDTVLPFGMRSAPKIFNAVADPDAWVCRNEGVQEALHYLDDLFVFGAPDSSECSDYLFILRSVFQRLGVPIAEHKTAGPSSKTIQYSSIQLLTPAASCLLDRPHPVVGDGRTLQPCPSTTVHC